ncbi:MAG: sulfite exporter TauE/SafE family protein [Microbacteriaceae bacterium]
MNETQTRNESWLPYLLIGLVAGLMSGFFGVGGGTVIVPALLIFAGFNQRRAAGTSLAAIIPPAIAGLLGYLPSGGVDWVAGGIIAAGSIVGAQIGSWLLHKLPVVFLRWLFIVFLVAVMVQLFFTVPDRSVGLEMNLWIILALALLGFVTGILAGLIGVGGGIVVVPVLMLFFGVSDLVAKGTSLLMILPTSVSGTLGNAKRNNVDLKAALIIGLTAAIFSFVGVQLALITDPQLGTILFACYILILIVRMVFDAIKKSREK